MHMADDANKEGAGAEGQGQDGQDAVSPEQFKKAVERAQRFEAQLKDLEKKHQQFASMYKDIDPDEAKALKTKLEEAERKAAEKDPAKMEELFERKLNKFKQGWDEEKTTITYELEKLRKENKTLKVTDKVMSEIAGLFNPDALKFIRREVEEQCDLDDDNTIVVKDEDGSPIFKNGKYLGIKDFGEMLVERYPSLAKAQGVSGSKDSGSGQKVHGRQVREPQSYAELVQMGPAGKEWLDNAKKTPEGQRKVQQILETMSARG